MDPIDRRSFLAGLGASAAVCGMATSAAAAPAPSTPRMAPTPPAPIVLDAFFVAGYRYHDGPLVEPGLAEARQLRAQREPDNPHDDRAIALHLADARVGYVPRRCNRPLAALLDAGATLRFRVDRFDPAAVPWERVAVVAEILLPEAA